MRLTTTLLTLPLLLMASTATAAQFHDDRCVHTAPHSLRAALDGATSITVIGRAGSLRVTGANVAEATATGTACSSDRDFLDRMRIEARRVGSEVRIEAIIPERTALFGWSEARLDFEVTVPAHLPVRVEDSSGRAEIANVAALSVVDGSGELEIRNVRGFVDVRDGSGAIRLTDIGGDIRLEDGSGEVEIERAGGSVRVVSDGSGELDFRDVRGDVIIESDGSGAIRVSDVRGNFIVESDGSGGIEYDRVGGRIQVPRDR